MTHSILGLQVHNESIATCCWHRKLLHDVCNAEVSHPPFCVTEFANLIHKLSMQNDITSDLFSHPQVIHVHTW